MKVDAIKFQAAIDEAGIKQHVLVKASGLSRQRIFQLRTDGGHCNPVLVEAMAAKLGKTARDLAG